MRVFEQWYGSSYVSTLAVIVGADLTGGGAPIFTDIGRLGSRPRQIALCACFTFLQNFSTLSN